MEEKELKRLTKLEEAGLLSEEEKGKLEAFRSAKAEVKSPIRETEPDFLPNFIEVDTETFEGGGQFILPSKPDIYPAVCEGYIIPSTGKDQVWFTFTNLKGAEERFRGGLIAGTKAGAWKIKDILNALAVEYVVEPDQGVHFADIRGRECQVEWAYVNIGGVRQLRIQNIYPKGIEKSI